MLRIKIHSSRMHGGQVTRHVDKGIEEIFIVIFLTSWIKRAATQISTRIEGPSSTRIVITGVTGNGVPWYITGITSIIRARIIVTSSTSYYVLIQISNFWLPKKL